jgi:hypothetical protein
MNCKKCNNILPPNTRFCPTCGTPVIPNAMESREAPEIQTKPLQPRPIEAEATSLTDSGTAPLPQYQPPETNSLNPSTGAMTYPQPEIPKAREKTAEATSMTAPGTTPPLQYQPPVTKSVYPPAGAITYPQQEIPKARKKPAIGCCLVSIALVLVLLAVALGTVWPFVLRPYLHNIAETEINYTMTQASQQLPTIPIKSPVEIPLPPITNERLETLIRLNMTPNDPIRNPIIHITPDGIRMDFQLYSFPCAISLVPVLEQKDQNKTLVIKNVKIEGILSLVMSSSEMEDLLNQNIAQTMQRLNYPVTNIELKDGELDMTVN